MTPSERHTVLQDLTVCGLSHRAACRWAGFSRAVATYALQLPAQEAAHLAKIHQASQKHPRYGYRRIAVVSGLGFGQTWRLWQRHGFRLAPQRPRKRRKNGSEPNRPHRAEFPNHVWTYDFLFDRLADGRPFKTLSILDEFTRECLAIRVATSIRSQEVLSVLQQLIAERGTPAFLRSDNGSEFTATAVQHWLEDAQVGTLFIPPGHPWENGFIESFHDKFRDECLQREWFLAILEAQIVIEAWRSEYNTERPHSSLNYQTPAAFAAKAQKQAEASLIPNGHKI
jgi:transposase InsO family protein